MITTTGSSGNARETPRVKGRVARGIPGWREGSSWRKERRGGGEDPGGSSPILTPGGGEEKGGRILSVSALRMASTLGTG